MFCEAFQLKTCKLNLYSHFGDKLGYKLAGRNLFAQVLVPVDVEQEEGTEETICLRMCLDEFSVQAIVFANLILAANIQVIAELLDIDRVIKVLVLEVMHVLACGAIEPDDRFSRVWSSDIKRINCEVEPIRIVHACVRPDFIEAALPNIDSKLQLLCIVGDFFAKAVGNTHSLWIRVLCRWIVITSHMDAPIRRWVAIPSIQPPSRLLVSEDVIFVLAGNISVVGELVEDQSPWMIETTSFQVHTTRRSSVSIVPIHFIAVCTHHIKIPVMEYERSWLPFDSAKLLQECTSRPVVNEDAVRALAGNIKVVVQTKCKTPGSIEATTARLHEHIEKCTCVCIVS